MGGGTFVLKFDNTNYFTSGQTKAFSAPYGGVVQLCLDSSITSPQIQSIDGTSSSYDVFKYGHLFLSNVVSTTYIYTIPFGSYCEVYCVSGDIYYALYKYELIQS